MPKTKVSGCIVAYNGFDEVTNAVTSIISHTQGVDLHLYVVDNASPDGTGAHLAAAQLGQDVTVRCLAENVGFGSG
ncbi:MAG: glycosyltransferase, partial [Ruthenibacterium sp.]